MMIDVEQSEDSLFISVITEDGNPFAGNFLLLGVGGDVHSERQLDVAGRGVHHLLSSATLHNAVHASPVE